MDGTRCKPGSRNSKCSADPAQSRYGAYSLRQAATARGLDHDPTNPDHASRSRAIILRNSVGLSEATAIAMRLGQLRLGQMRLGQLLDLPEHPHKSDAKTDDDAQ